MSTFLEYVLKISLCYGIIYLFYFLLLRRLTHYVGNRFFLLVSSILALVIPLIRIDFFIAPKTIKASSIINSIPSVDLNATGKIFIPEGNSSSIAFMMLSLFIAGMVICTAHFFIQLFSFKKLKAAARLIDNRDGIKLYHLDMDIIPFSFGNAIYVNTARHSQDELSEIIQHESVHVHQNHTIDVLITELICILNWYNPFVWLIKNAVKQNLEFLADDAVIKNGADKKEYQYLLLKVIGHSPLTLATNLNFSSLRQRIYMMNKARTSKMHLLKFLFALPVIALVMFAFRDTSLKTSIENPASSFSKEETFKLSQLTYSIPDPGVGSIVKKEQEKSLLQVGKPFTITLIKNERDRLKTLLEKNGYNNISDHSISFLIDSSLTNNSFSVQVNIDLVNRSSVYKSASNRKLNQVVNAIDNRSAEIRGSKDNTSQSTLSSRHQKY
jgi:beta-lactamase regulating signal transducer with metallopeptidase domain